MSIPGAIVEPVEFDLPRTHPELPFVTPLETNTKSPNETSLVGSPFASTLLAQVVAEFTV